MKILIVGDTVDPRLYDHFQRSAFPEKLDLILSTGDVPAWYLTYLVSVFEVPLFYVRGNHDVGFADNPPEAAEDINERIVEFQGLNILGFEGCRYHSSEGAVQFTERQMWWKWQRLRPLLLVKRKIDIMLTHAPPYGIHDADDEEHQGFLTFSHLIHKYRPRFFIHGHAHLHYGYRQKRVDLVNETAVINGFGYHILEF